MSKEKHELTQDEQLQVLNALGGDRQQLKAYLENLSMSVRAVEGKPVDQSTVIMQLTDAANILERSRYPTYTQIQYQVYLRHIYSMLGDVAISCKNVADDISEALISYKGGSREEWVEQKKHAAGGEEQNIYFNKEPYQPQPAKRKRWFRRAPKPEHEELRD